VASTRPSSGANHEVITSWGLGGKRCAKVHLIGLLGSGIIVESQRGRVLLATQDVVRALVMPGTRCSKQYCMHGTHYITHPSRVRAVPYHMSFCCAVRGKLARHRTSQWPQDEVKCLATTTSADCFYDVMTAQT